MPLIPTIIVVALSAWFLVRNIRKFRAGEISNFGLVVAILITFILLIFGECAVMIFNSNSGFYRKPG